MDIGRSIGYVFEDERWLTKLGTGALISLVPILNFAWLGYSIEIMRNVMEDLSVPLPEWDDLGGKFIKGLFVAAAGFLYALPGLVFLTGTIGIFLFPAIANDSDIRNILAVFSTLTGITLICCVGVYFLLLSLFFPAAQLQFARNGTFRSFFQVNQIFKMISGKAGDYLICWLTSLGVGFVVGSLTGVIGLLLGWIPCLGQILIWLVSLIAGVWAGVVIAHIFGQFGSRQELSALVPDRPGE